MGMGMLQRGTPWDGVALTIEQADFESDRPEPKKHPRAQD
jgi:hypothetical protein